MRPTSRFKKGAAAMLSALAFSRSALAQQLPQVPDVDGSGDGDFIQVIQSLAAQALTVMIFVVGAAAFILVGWSVIAKFNECRAGRAEWSEAAVTAGIGAAILVFTTFLLTQADAVFT